MNKELSRPEFEGHFNRHAGRRCAVIGIGNTLLGDEGVGVHVIERMRKRYRFSPEVALIDGGCGGLNLYFILERYDSIIMVDAMTPTAGLPGSICLIKDGLLYTQMSEGSSAHSIGLKDALTLLKNLATPPDALVLIGVVPAELDYSFKLSLIIQQRLEELEALIVKQLRLYDIEVSRL